MRKMLAGLLAGVLLLSGCTAQAAAKSDDTAAVAQQPAENAAVQGGFTENQTLDGADGIIHFSYYLPDGYDSAKTYPLIVAMPGYGEMWFGEDSAGGETMSRAVSMRPDLYAAYLHGASQWDGSYAPIAENSVAIYIYMADGDEYYGSAKARSAYENLHDAYENAGWSDADIDKVLRIETPGNAFFNEKGIYNYHGGANVVFDDPDNLNWVISHSKG